MKNFKAAVILILIATILPELATGSTSLTGFFSPGIFLFLFVGYGLAVLVIRELAVRNNFIYWQIFLVGTAYGIFNEGFLAKTMILGTNLPVSAYNLYGRELGINWPFALTIMPWHGLASVLLPILLTYWICREEKNQLWLNKKFTIVLTMALVLFGCVAFLSKDRVAGTVMQLIIFLMIMLVLILLASFSKKTTPMAAAHTPSLKPFWWGLSVFLFSTVISQFIAGKHFPVILYFVVLLAGFWFYYQVIHSHGWQNFRDLLIFGSGFYIQVTATAVVFAVLGGYPLVERVAAGIIIIILLFRLAVKASKEQVNLAEV